MGKAPQEARSHSFIGYTLPALLLDGQKQQQNSALPGFYYLQLVVVLWLLRGKNCFGHF